MTQARPLQRTGAELPGASGLAPMRQGGAAGFGAAATEASPASRLGRGLAWAVGLGALFWAAVAALVVALT